MSRDSQHQIFFDPTKRRSRYLKLLTFIFFISLVFAVSSFFLGTVTKPVLPSPDFGKESSIQINRKENSSVNTVKDVEQSPLPVKNHSLYTIANKQGDITFAPFIKNGNIGDRSSDLKFKEYKSVSTPPKKIAFYVNWDEQGLNSLKNNINDIDQLIPEWFYIYDKDGSIAVEDQQTQNDTIDYIKKNKPGLDIIPSVNNFNPVTNSWEGEKLQEMLNDKESRSIAVDNLFNLVYSNNFSGLVINFEDISLETNPGLDSFIDELSVKFHDKNLTISQSIFIERTPHDNWKPNKNIDYFIVRAFDERNGDKKISAAIASQNWYEKSLREWLVKIPREKCIISLGNFAYDWIPGEKSATLLSYQEVLNIAKNSNTQNKIVLNKRNLNPTFSYTDKDNKEHRIWFLDGITAFNQVSYANSYQPFGYAVWRLGTEDPSVWKMLSKIGEPDKQIVKSLTRIPYEKGVHYEGEGGVSKLTSAPVFGSRKLTYNNLTQKIVQEEVDNYPSSYNIKTWGHTNPGGKKIVITFDDGPDDKYTPEILDILNENQVKATFFVVGTSVLQHPDIIKRIVEEGHTLGNHTFSHPDISRISSKQLGIELSTVQRILEGITDRKTVLFRAPYGEDGDPKTNRQLLALATLSDYNYFNVGIGIDPKDWRNEDPGVIVDKILNQVKNSGGGILLLHDAGGNRENTAIALATVIPELKKQGFEIASLADYIGVPQDQLMPKLSVGEEFYAYSSKATYSTVSWLMTSVKFLFFLGIIIGFSRSLLILVLATIQWNKSRTETIKNTQKKHNPLVSIIVPAYNESKVVCRTIKSLLANTYKKFEIIFVDDGSTDDTYKKVFRSFSKNPKISIFSISNGGKSNALNFGIKKCRGEVLITLDADTIFQPDTIEKLARHFEDPRVGAVAGNAKVGNRNNWLTKFQALEYVTSQNLDRRAFDFMNCISVVPGAIGAWRRKAILKAKGFSHHTLAEDADLTFSLIRNKYKVVYEDGALAFTEAPDKIGCFLKQRFRWMFGTLQTVWKHRDISFRPKYKALGLFTIPNVLIFQIIFPFLSPILDLMVVISIFWAIWQNVNHITGEYSGFGHLNQILFFYIIFMLLDFTISTVAFLFEKKEDKKLLVWIFPQRLFYRQLMYYISIKTIYTAVKGSQVGWNKLERKNTVELEGAYASDSTVL